MKQKQVSLEVTHDEVVFSTVQIEQSEFVTIAPVSIYGPTLSLPNIELKVSGPVIHVPPVPFASR